MLFYDAICLISAAISTDFLRYRLTSLFAAGHTALARPIP
jgi:hypothetical protein